MIFQTWMSILACFIALVLTMLLQRRSGLTIALPLAYMVSLLLIHLPGAYAFAASGGESLGIVREGEAVASGIYLTAIGALCFVVGLSLVSRPSGLTISQSTRMFQRIDPRFVFFCMVAGWILAFGAGSLRYVPTLGAAIYFGSAIWMLVTAIRLSGALQERNLREFGIWLGALLAYPIVVLVFSGFLSYGAAAVIIAGSLGILNLKSAFRSLWVLFAISFLGLSVFVNYFGSRSELRDTLWTNAGFEQRLDATVTAFSSFRLFNTGNSDHLQALSARLNQNDFTGLAAIRLERGQSEFLRGSSFYSALIAPIPRILWKDKPKEGGSVNLVRDATGLRLGEKTSWGVGNVMELYINFGMWSLTLGFVLFGSIIGWLDRKAAVLLLSPTPAKALLYFLPCVAFIQPNGSLSEVVGGAFAALLAAYFLQFAFKIFEEVTTAQSPAIAIHPSRGVR
jgi:hypothetical protein